MPFPFTLPTTSSFTFSSNFSSSSHPSLPLTASTYRGVVRETLKKHKRLPPSSQPANLNLVVSALKDYIPYLIAIDAGLKNRTINNSVVSVHFVNPPLKIEWRPTLSASLPGRETPRIKIGQLEHEVTFAISTLGMAYTLQARAALQPLFVMSIASPGPEERLQAIQTATKHLLDAASVYSYLSTQGQSLATEVPCPDVATPTASALAAISLAEATLLAVLKDDPYPAVVAQGRNVHDKEWMFKAPDIPKVRAHLFARLCLSASEHAAKAYSLCAGVSKGGHKVDESFLKYTEDLKRTARARACRFFGIDADLGAQTGTAIAWTHAGLSELGVETKGDEDTKKKGLSFSRLKREWSEKKEDKKVEKGGHWGADAGKIEETRVLEMLEAKWVKENDTMNTQRVPPTGQLMTQMPSGRDIHKVPPYSPPMLESDDLEPMQAAPDREDMLSGEASSDDESSFRTPPAGAYPGTHDEYSRSSPTTAYY
ncbi:hypothetical protein MKZ38_003643 [Zalerion maritima]|uniref:pH-response regulator protein palC n=1 Tax=Zalerion maritima TaxID=339359 RepID=A0AAD5RU62_9PEZI|nr:hypothetical protein MKZ38_003643 [Zalerion maritima]